MGIKREIKKRDRVVGITVYRFENYCAFFIFCLHCKKNECNFTESDGSRVAMNFVKIQIGVIFLLQALLAFKDFKNVAHLTI